MKAFIAMVITQRLLLFFMSLLVSLPAFSVVTYDGEDGVKNKIFYKNSESINGCVECHAIGLADGIPRYYATLGFDFDTYTNVTKNHPDQVNFPGVTVAERAVARVSELTMPNFPDDPALGTVLITDGLISSEVTLMTSWQASGYPELVQPTKTTIYPPSIGKYAAFLKATLNRNGWGFSDSNSTTLDTRYIFQIKPSASSVWSNVGSYYYSNAYNTGSKSVSDGGVDSNKTRYVPGLACGTSYDVQIDWEFQFTNLIWYVGASFGGGAGNITTFPTAACPSISTSTLPTAFENEAYSTIVQSINSGNSPSYSLTVFPAGMLINSTTGEITWTPPEATMNYSESVTVRVTDGTTPAFKSFTLEVSANADPPVITEGALINNTMSENTDYVFSLSATDVDFNTLTWTESLSPLNGVVTIKVITPVGSADSTVSVRFRPDFNYFGDNHFDLKVTDANAGIDVIRIDLKITSNDYDHDGVQNISDNCINTVNADQINTDGDTQGDACDDDDDNDLIPDTFEIANGLNPLVEDSNLDADGDGDSNLEEYNNGTDVNTDTVAPVIVVPADIVINATGLLTLVDFGMVTANDVKDGVLIPSPDKTGPFESGQHIVEWTVSDATGNTAKEKQAVDVIPSINFDVDQQAGEGSFVIVNYELSGDAAIYPVSFNYAVTGTAVSSDSDVTPSGVATIVSGRIGAITLNIALDVVADDGETIIFSMSNFTNTFAGENIIHTITIKENNVAPSVSLQISQSAENRAVVYKDQGVVTVTATANDINPTDTLTYDWNQTVADLKAINTSGFASSSFVFNPSGLDTGSYLLDLTVSDSLLTTRSEILVRVEDTAPVLTTADSDNDGITDDVEGVKDSDGDGISDYLDSIDQLNILQNQTGNMSNQINVQTEPGLQIVIGQYAVASARKGASIDQDNILSATGLTELPGLTLAGETSIYDIEIHGLTSASNTAYVVMPLQSAIQSDVSFYVYNGASGWQVFIEDSENQLTSSKLNASGFCPVPMDPVYSDDLTVFDYCVQLLVEDGGPNDADQEVNGVIRITGAVAYVPAVAEEEPEEAVIGLLNPMLLLFMFGLLFYINRKKIKK